MRAAGAVLKVHGMAAVQVRAPRYAIRIARPQRARRVSRVQPERFRVLSEPVDVRRGGKRRLHAEVLRLEDERVRRSGEEHLARARAGDVEREWRGIVGELKLRRLRVHVRVCGRPR